MEENEEERVGGMRRRCGGAGPSTESEQLELALQKRGDCAPCAPQRGGAFVVGWKEAGAIAFVLRVAGP